MIILSPVLNERIRVTSEPYFEDYVRDTHHIRAGTQDEDQDNEDLKDSGYWSSDDLPLERLTRSQTCTSMIIYGNQHAKNTLLIMMSNHHQKM